MRIDTVQLYTGTIRFRVIENDNEHSLQEWLENGWKRISTTRLRADILKKMFSNFNIVYHVKYSNGNPYTVMGESRIKPYLLRMKFMLQYLFRANCDVSETLTGVTECCRGYVLLSVIL